MQRAGRCTTCKIKVREFVKRRGRETTRTPSFFSSGIISATTKRSDKLSQGPKGKQLSAFQHGRLIGLFIRRANDGSSPRSSRHAGGWGGGSQETSLTCQRWKSLLARTQSAKLNPTGQMLPIDACRRGLARKIHLTLTESKHMLESTHTSKQT